MSAIDRPKILAIISFLFSLPAGYYFLAKDIFQAVVFMLLADFSDAAAMRFQKKKGAGWKPAIKTAIERCCDAAIFIGFALSGIVNRNYGIALLVAAIIVPFWAQAIWKKNVRWAFHAAVYLYILAMGV